MKQYPIATSRWEVDDHVSYLLARASHAVAWQFHREIRAAGLTVLEWRVLATLADGRARTVGELASIGLAQQSTVTKLVGRLATEGRVDRSDGETDRRQSLVRITPAGREALGRLLARSKKHEAAILQSLDAHETTALKDALKKLIAMQDVRA